MKIKTALLVSLEILLVSILVTGLAALASGCGPISTSTSTNAIATPALRQIANTNSYLSRYYDKDSMVLCYVAIGGTGVGVSCVGANELPQSFIDANK